MYKPWDTYSAWRGKSHNIKRLLAAWIILFTMPLLHFAILFVLLGSFNVRFDMTIRGISNVALISLSSFFDFGYFRIYEAFLHRYPEPFFSDEERVQKELYRHNQSGFLGSSYTRSIVRDPIHFDGANSDLLLMRQFQVRIFWNLILTYEDGYTLAVLECDGIKNPPRFHLKANFWTSPINPEGST